LRVIHKVQEIIFFMDEPAFPQGKWEGFTVVYGNHDSVAEESDVGMDLTEANRVPFGHGSCKAFPKTRLKEK